MPGLRQAFSRWHKANSNSPTPRKQSSDRRHQPERRRDLREIYSNEVRVRCAAQEVGFGTYELDCVTGQVRWSPELRGIAGLPQEGGPLSLNQVQELVYPDDRERFMVKLHAALDPHGSGEFDQEFRLQQPNESVVWVKAKGRTFFAGDGGDRRPLGETGVIMDITERKLAEAATQLRERSFHDAVHGAAVGIWNWDPRTGEATFSDRCRQLFDISDRGTINTARFLETLHPEDRERTLAAIQWSLENHREYHVEYRLRWPDGSVHWIEALGSGFYDVSSDAAVSMSGIAIDITDRKLQEERLREDKARLESEAEESSIELGQTKQALEDSNLELQHFAYIAAHDMQTPLRSISGFAQLLQRDYEGRLDSQADVWISHMVRSVHRMQDVIKDTLDYFRVEGDGNHFSPVNLDKLFDDVVATLDAPIRETRAQVTRDPLPIVTADRVQLGQVLQNLIDNALKYHGQEMPRVHVSAHREGDHWVFSVRDNGIGIPEKYREHIFEIFRRLHTQQDYPGTGIGLAICRRVIQRHGGEIWVESKPGEGSTFYFTLPDPTLSP